MTKPFQKRSLTTVFDQGGTIPVQIIEGSLALTTITTLRNKETHTQAWRTALHNLSLLLAIHASEYLPEELVEIQTPLESTQGHRFATPIVLCPVMRAGAGMEPAFRQFFPDATTWHISMSRNPETLQPEFRGSSIPARIAQRNETPSCFVLDPMLATGGSASLAIQKLKDAGARHLIFVGAFAAPEGVRRLTDDHPDIPMVLGVMDRCLNEIGYIEPGCGDAGDRYNGTVHEH